MERFPCCCSSRSGRTATDDHHPTECRHRRSVRARLLDAANELFYDEGVQTVGIDRIIERAGVAKGSLYNTFGSKEELVWAYLQSRHGQIIQRLTQAVQKHTDPVDRLLAVFDAKAEIFAQPDFRGCAFISASAEAPPGGLIQRAADDYRKDIRGLFVRLACEAEVTDPTAVGHQLHLIYDGAAISAHMDSDSCAAIRARAAAVTLLDAELRNKA
jgi:AcrR family transcriptional regulator